MKGSRCIQTVTVVACFLISLFVTDVVNGAGDIKIGLASVGDSPMSPKGGVARLTWTRKKASESAFVSIGWKNTSGLHYFPRQSLFLMLDGVEGFEWVELPLIDGEFKPVLVEHQEFFRSDLEAWRNAVVGLMETNEDFRKTVRNRVDMNDQRYLVLAGIMNTQKMDALCDQQDGEVLLKKAADNLDPWALVEHGKWLQSGDAPNAKKEALRYFRKAAVKDYSPGIFALGHCYEKGIGVLMDDAEAVKWYRKAAEAGNTDGMFSLGICYLEGLGVPKDDAEAVKWFRKAAEAGNMRGMVALGHRYAQALGVPKDDAEAVKWFRKAAEAGNMRGMVALGHCYAQGRGVPKDDEKAVEWYRKAAEAGNTDGMAELGVRYAQGGGVTQDDAEAVKWSRKAAEAGNTRGMVVLGHCYAQGRGVPKDDEKAVEWYRKAAEAGNTVGMIELGICYEKGFGVSKDTEKAEK